jgi:hypothetical protein
LCLWPNSNKGQGLEVLILSNPKIKQSSHCCGAPSRLRVGAAPIDGRIPARSASDQDDQAGMVSGLTSKRQKMIAVAADEDQSLQTGVAKDLFIG